VVETVVVDTTEGVGTGVGVPGSGGFATDESVSADGVDAMSEAVEPLGDAPVVASVSFEAAHACAARETISRRAAARKRFVMLVPMSATASQVHVV
jgi:hypothetical protein